MTRITFDFAETSEGQKILLGVDLIEAVDESKNFRKQLWGQNIMAAFRLPGSPPHQVKQVEITVDSSQPGEALRAEAAVKKAMQN